jgi:hypothetical protein
MLWRDTYRFDCGAPRPPIQDADGGSWLAMAKWLREEDKKARAK